MDQLEWDMKMIKTKHHMQQSNISGNIWVMMSFKRLCGISEDFSGRSFAVLEEIWQNSKGYRTIGDWFEHVERYGEILKEQNCKKMRQRV